MALTPPGRMQRTQGKLICFFCTTGAAAEAATATERTERARRGSRAVRDTVRPEELANCCEHGFAAAEHAALPRRSCGAAATPTTRDVSCMAAL